MRVSLKTRSVLLYLGVLCLNAGIMSLIVIFHEYWFAFAPIIMLGSVTSLWYMSWILMHYIYLSFKGRP